MSVRVTGTASRIRAPECLVEELWVGAQESAFLMSLQVVGRGTDFRDLNLELRGQRSFSLWFYRFSSFLWVRP